MLFTYFTTVRCIQKSLIYLDSQQALHFLFIDTPIHGVLGAGGQASPLSALEQMRPWQLAQLSLSPYFAHVYLEGPVYYSQPIWIG